MMVPFYYQDLAPVVQKVASAIQWINHYPLDKSIRFVSVYPVDSAIHLLNNPGQNAVSGLYCLANFSNCLFIPVRGRKDLTKKALRQSILVLVVK